MSTLPATEVFVPDTTAVEVAVPEVPVGETHTYDLVMLNTHATVDCYLNTEVGDDEVTPAIIPAVDKDWTRPERTFRFQLVNGDSDTPMALYAAAPGTAVGYWKLIKRTS